VKGGHDMKYIIMALTVMLAAMLFVLEVSKTQATSVEIYEIVCEDHQGNVVKSEYFAAGANLNDFEFPAAPERVGYVFVGWSAELPKVMPYANLVYVPIYMQQQLSLNITV
jgi:hypothetical protein